MLRDDSGSGGGRPSAPRNVLGDRLDVCSTDPKTGFFRDGCCNTNGEDVGSHTICAVITAAFLEFSQSCGNDLTTPMPQFGFPGLKPGVCTPLARSTGGGLRAPRGLAGYSRRRPRPLLARRSQAFRPGPRLSSTIALGGRINASQSGLSSPCYHASAGGKSAPARARRAPFSLKTTESPSSAPQPA